MAATSAFVFLSHYDSMSLDFKPVELLRKRKLEEEEQEEEHMEEENEEEEEEEEEEEQREKDKGKEKLEKENNHTSLTERASKLLHGAIVEGKREEALHFATFLWEKSPDFGAKKVDLNAHNSRVMAWKVLMDRAKFENDKERTELDEKEGIWPKGMRKNSIESYRSAWIIFPDERLFFILAILVLTTPYPKQLWKNEKLEKEIIIQLEKEVYGNEAKKLSIADEAVDKHTSLGKKMGRGVEHFFTEGAKVDKEGIKDPYRDMAFSMYLEQERLYGKNHRTKHVRERKKQKS